MARRIEPTRKSVKEILDDLVDFHGALELCERAIALDLGGHWLAKRDSLDWAR